MAPSAQSAPAPLPTLLLAVPQWPSGSTKSRLPSSTPCSLTCHLHERCWSPARTSSQAISSCLCSAAPCHVQADAGQSRQWPPRRTRHRNSCRGPESPGGILQPMCSESGRGSGPSGLPLRSPAPSPVACPLHSMRCFAMKKDRDHQRRACHLVLPHAPPVSLPFVSLPFVSLILPRSGCT